MPNLAGKRYLFALKTKVHKNLANSKSNLDDFEARVDDLDADKLKALPKYWKNLIDVQYKEVVKKTAYNKLNTKVNNLKKRVPYATTLIYINQYKAYNQILERKKSRC